MTVCERDDPVIVCAEALRSSARERASRDVMTADGSIERGLVDLHHLMRTTDGDPSHRAVTIALLAATLPPADQAAAVGELRDIARSLSADAVDAMTRSASPHIRAGGRILARLRVDDSRGDVDNHEHSGDVVDLPVRQVANVTAEDRSRTLPALPMSPDDLAALLWIVLTEFDESRRERFVAVMTDLAPYLSRNRS